MKCYYHPDRDAVGQCEICHKNLCRECIDTTGLEKPVCLECGIKLSDQDEANNKQAITVWKKAKRNEKILLTWVSVWYLLGIIAILCDDSNNVYVYFWTIIFMCGIGAIPFYFINRPKTLEDKQAALISDLRWGIQPGFGAMFGKFIGSLIISPIYDIFCIIGCLRRIPQYRKLITNSEQEIKNWEEYKQSEEMAEKKRRIFGS